MTNKPTPPIDAWTEPYWTAAHEGKLLIQFCPECQKHIFYPRQTCPYCYADQVVWVEASGRGKVYAFSVVRNNAPSAFLDEMPFVIAIVHLEEGVPMMTNIIDCDPEALHSGMPVEVTFRPLTDEMTLPVFKPVAGPD